MVVLIVFLVALLSKVWHKTVYFSKISKQGMPLGTENGGLIL